MSDQGFTYLASGCTQCGIWQGDTRVRPAFVITTRHGHRYWTCPMCRGDFGEVEDAPFQQRVDPWLLECFGEDIARDRVERSHRFIEEALELVQAAGCTASEAHQLVDYVFGRPVGVLSQEVGGVMVTLAALCLAHATDMHAAGDIELARVWTKVETIRAKHAAKPKFSPLPGAEGPVNG